ncbi:MAG: L-threonylcarbamoyladenylate synthase, partial [Elusimicrobiota bacterium]
VSRGAGKDPDRTILHKLKAGRFSAAAVEDVFRALHEGGLAIFPTDTVYGLAAGVFRPEAIRRIYRLKGRSYKKPLPLLVAHPDQARALVEPLSKKLEALLEEYWPGPLTVVFKTSSLGRWVTGGKDTVAVRIPRHPAALAVLRRMGQPLAVTSANPSGEEPAVTGAAALKIFKGRVDVLLDGGPCPGGEASTVLDASSFHWTLVREGAVKKRELLRYIH